MRDLIEEDFKCAHLLVEEIVDNTDVSDIYNKLEEYASTYKEGNRKRQFLSLLNGLFQNVILNELHWRCKEAESRAQEGRMVTKTLNNNSK